MGYPSSQPAWQQQQLNELSQEGLLSGINPLVLAGIEQNESGFENAGAGINSSGYGGFFGLGQNSTYTNPAGQSFTETPSLLESGSQASYDQQAQASAAEVANLMASTGSLQGALSEYTGGGPTNGDYELAVSDLGGASPTLTGQQYPVTGGAGTPVANATTPTQANLTGLSLSNIGNVLSGNYVARGLIIIVGLILLKVGIDHLLGDNSSPLSIAAQAPQSFGGGGGSSRGMRAPGGGREEPSEEEEGEPEEEEPHEEPPHHHAEHAAEDAAAAAAA